MILPDHVSTFRRPRTECGWDQLNGVGISAFAALGCERLGARSSHHQKLFRAGWSKAHRSHAHTAAPLRPVLPPLNQAIVHSDFRGVHQSREDSIWGSATLRVVIVTPDRTCGVSTLQNSDCDYRLHRLAIWLLYLMGKADPPQRHASR